MRYVRRTDRSLVYTASPLFPHTAVPYGSCWTTLCTPRPSIPLGYLFRGRFCPGNNHPYAYILGLIVTR